MDRTPLLRAQHLGVERDGRHLLDDVSLTVNAGEILALIGPNGAGKSTLLKAIAQILPARGEVLLDGRPVQTLSRQQRARLLAYVPQHSALDAPMVVREVVAQGRFAHRDGWGRSSREDDAAIADALAATDTTRLADRGFSRLSYGERRLVLLARALVTEAKVLLLDEPTAALDVAHALALLSRLRTLAGQGYAIVVILHHLAEVVEFCHRALLLRQGHMICCGEVGDVVSAQPVRDVFGVELIPGAHFGYRVPGEESR